LSEEAESDLSTKSLQHFLDEHDMSTEGLNNLKTYGLRNIRDIKELIFSELIRRKSIKISDITTPMSPASILIIFLHLVNERDL
jgi:hypothetical protein